MRSACYVSHVVEVGGVSIRLQCQGLLDHEGEHSVVILNADGAPVITFLWP